MGDNNLEQDNNAGILYLKLGAYNGNLDDMQEVKIDNCNYEISKSKVTIWIEQYGKIKSELE